MTSGASAANSHEGRNGQIIRNIILLGGGQALSMVLGLLLTATLGRKLGASDFGTYFIIITIAGFVGVIVEWGQTSYVVREIARGRPDRAEFLGSAIFLRSLGMVVAAGGALGLAIILGYASLVVWLAPLAVVVGAPGSFAQFLGYAFRGIDRTDIDVFAGLISKAGGVFATILALYLGGGVSAAVLIPAIGGLLAFAYAIRMTRQVGLTISAPDTRTTREIWLIGAPIAVMSISISIHGFVEVTLLAMLSSADVVGWHGAARAVIGVLLTPALILSTASFPELCRAADSPDQLRRVVSSASRLLLAVASLASCMLFLFADTVVRIIYGQGQFDSVVLILLICAPMFPIFFLNFLMGNTANAVGRNIQIAGVKIACVAISAVASWFLIQIFQVRFGNGAAGVMLSYCVAELLMTLGIVAILPRGIVAKETIAHVLRAYATLGIVILTGMQIVAATPLWLSIAVVILLFAASSAMTGLVRASDLHDATAVVRSILGRIRKSRK